MRAASVLLHVGYHKTGTTWLQTGLFADPASGFTRPWAGPEIRDRLVGPTEFTFEPETARRAFTPGIEEAHRRGLVPVVSDERLSGTPHAGGHDSATVARRLARVFPHTRVVLGIREQRRAIYSTYLQYVRDGGTAPLRGYLHPRNRYELPQMRLAHWEYHHLIGLYRELFGAEHVLVFAYEELARDPGGLAGRIASFAGLAPSGETPAGERYPAPGPAAMVLKRWFNRLFVRTALSPAAPFYVKDHERRFARLDRRLPAAASHPLERRWRAEVEEAVGEHFAHSNRLSASLTGLDLAGLGYPVA